MAEQDFDNPRMWEIPKPFLKDFFVPFSVYDPSFHKRKITKTPATLDPCCTSCREKSDVVTLCVYVDDESYLPQLDFVSANAVEIEKALIVKIRAVHERILAQHFEDNLPGMPDWQKHWDFILADLGGTPEDLYHRMFKLTGMSIVYSEEQKEWAVGYEFQTGWDMDHGLEIVMWKEKVLTSDGMLVLTSTEGCPFVGAKVNQEYELDPGDYPLP